MMSKTHQGNHLPTIPCVRGRNKAAQILRNNAFQELNRKDSLVSSSSYASNSSWKSQSDQNKYSNEVQIMLPTVLPYLANKAGLQDFESARNSWQSYIESSEWEEEGYEKRAFFTTLAQQQNTNIIIHEGESGDDISSLESCSEVNSSLSGYTDCNKDDIAIWKKLEKALDVRFNNKDKRQVEIPSSLQPGSPFSSQYFTTKHSPGRFSEPPKLPIPPNITPRPNTLIYQYQRVTAAGSAAKHRRIYSGGQHKQQFM